MKQLLTALLIAILVFGCRGKDASLKNILVDSSYMVHVNTKEASINGETIRINGMPKIVYDTCETHMTIFGLSVSTSQRISIRGLFASNDTIYLNKESAIVFYGKNDSVLKVITGSDRPTPKPSPLPDTIKPIKDSGIIDLGDIEWHCLVAHCTEDGCFTCDYHEHYFPYEIYNDSIKKWFIKMIGKDSMFYYRHADDTSNYIWNGDKNDECGYDLKYNGEVVSSLCVKYNGHDTIQIINQVWNESPPIPKPSPLPDTTKPLKIKMQPRWRDDSIAFSKKTETDWVLDVQPTPYYKNDSTWNNNDTTKAILLVSDTSSVNGFRSSRCWWMEGYVVHLSFSRGFDVLEIDKNGNAIWPETPYLDQSKVKLKKNFIVWLSKEIK